MKINPFHFLRRPTYVVNPCSGASSPGGSAQGGLTPFSAQGGTNRVDDPEYMQTMLEDAPTPTLTLAQRIIAAILRTRA